MNDDTRFELFLEDSLRELAPNRAPDRLRTTIKTESSRMRPRPRWLALVKEPPMRTSSALAVGSPTVRLAAIVAATLLLMAALAGAGLAGARLLAADGTLVVDQAGGGDYTTIGEAVAAASDDDTILVRPGTYVEAVIIDSDLTLKGDGPVEDIVVTAPQDGPVAPVWTSQDPYAFLIEDADAQISNLTLRGERSQVIIKGGAPTLERMVLEGTGHALESWMDENDGSSIALTDGSTAVIRGNTLVGGGPIAVFSDSVPIIEGNTLTDGPHIFGDFPDGGVIRDNLIERPIVRGIGLGSGAPIVEGNTVLDSRDIGIQAHAGTALVKDNLITGAKRGIYIDTDDAAPILEANDISGSTEAGISVNGARPSVQANVLRDNAMAIDWFGWDGLIDGNEIAGGTTGIHIRSGTPMVSANSVQEVDGPGIAIVGRLADPTLTGNTSCDNVENLFIEDLASAQVDDSNEICEVTASS
jgi:hypothetical protein